MLTPKEQLLLDRLNTIPGFQELQRRLDLTPVLSENFKKSTMISARVDVLIDQFEKARSLPHNQRSILPTGEELTYTDIWCLKTEINRYLESIYGPQPWKLPLPHAPF